MVFENFNVPVSMEIIIILLLIGALIKHLLTKIDNKFIPAILFLIGVALTIADQWPITLDNLITTITTALATTLIAVGAHSSGKNFFANGQFLNLFLSTFTNMTDIPIENINIENMDNRTEKTESEEQTESMEEENKEVEQTDDSNLNNQYE